MVVRESPCPLPRYSDGVYAAGPAARPEFHELPPTEDADVLYVTTLMASRVVDLIRRRGLEDEADALSDSDPGLAALYAAVVRGRIATGPNAGNRLVTFGGDQIDGDSLEAMTVPAALQSLDSICMRT